MFNKEKIKEEGFSLGWKRFKKEIIKEKIEVIKIFFLVLILYLIQSGMPYLHGKILDFLIHSTKNTFFNITLDTVFWFFIIFVILKIIHLILALWIYKIKLPKIANKIYIKYWHKG